MKHIFSTLTLLFASMLFSQVSIGKSSITNNMVSLEFGSEDRGIVLPWVSTIAGSPNADGSWNAAGTQYAGMTSAENGTIILDISDYKFKYRKYGAWFDLTVKDRTTVAKDGFGTTNITNNVINSSIQDSKNDNAAAETSIGIPTPVTGVLVLEESTKAMILPKVASYANIIKPSPGMMVYDTTKKMLCLYNGTVWSFWTYTP